MSDKFSTKLASFFDDLISNHTLAAVGAVILVAVAAITGLTILEQMNAALVPAAIFGVVLGVPIANFLWKAPGLIHKHFFKK